RSTIQSLWPSLCYLGIVILFLNRGRWLWLGFLFLVALLPISIRRERGIGQGVRLVRRDDLRESALAGGQ
ncbi:MAG: hypothetical protein WBQ29_22180, partial [Isosphaeraceae bacterium]